MTVRGPRKENRVLQGPITWIVAYARVRRREKKKKEMDKNRITDQIWSRNRSAPEMLLAWTMKVVHTYYYYFALAGA